MRRFSFGGAVLAGALLLGALIPTLAQSRGPGVVGDVNGDGRITSADALAVYAYLAGRPVPPTFDILGRGDADGDGNITRADADLIMRAAVGKSDPDRPVGKPQEPGAVPASGPMMVQCVANVPERTVSCGQPGAPGGADADRIEYGGQNLYVKLISGTPSVAGNIFAFDVRVQNLIPQPIGTEDGVSPDAIGGVRVFFARPIETVSNGPASAMEPINHHGEATFFGSQPQKFYSYPGVLAQGDTSAAQRWELEFGANVQTFKFLLFISAPVQFPKGWVDVYPKDTTIFVGNTVQLVDTVRSQVGKPLPGVPVTWTSVDAALATVSNTGLVTAVAPGVDTIVASAVGPRTGRSIIRILANPASYRVEASDTTPAAGDTITVTAQVVDALGNPVPLPGRTITWSVTNARGTFSAPTSNTDNAGLASVSFYADSVVVAGADTLKASDGTNGGALPFSIVAEAPASYRVVLSDTTPAVRDTILVTAQLKDRFGNDVPLAGRLVDFTQTGGAQFVDPATDIPTDAGGKATVRVVPNDVVGSSQTVTATDDGPVTGTSPDFVTQVGAAAKLAVTTQPPATVESGLAFVQQPVVQVQDAAGNPVSQAGIVVAAAIASGDAALGGTLTATTTAGGVATFTDLAITGAVGERTLSFSATGLAPATSNTITVEAGAATQIVITTQPSGTVQSGTAFPQQPVVQLQDASGNAVAQGNVTITAAIATGAGTLGGTTTANTNAAGQATFADLSISGIVGDRTLSFSSGSLTEATSETVTVTAGVASQLVITTQPSATAQSGIAFAQQPVVQLQDAAGNAVSQENVTVTVAIATGGGTLGGTSTANTSASGAATFTDLSIAGTVGARTLSFNATGVSQATSNSIDITAGAPAVMTKQAGTDAQSASAGTAVTNAPSVLVTDAASNPVSGVEVTFAVATGGGSVTGATATTNASGVATVGSWTMGNTAGANSLTATAGALSVTFTATGTPGLPATITKTSTDPQTGQPGTAIGAAPSVTVTDAFGNAVPGATVNFTVAGGGGSLTGGSQTTNASGAATVGSWTPGSGPGINTLQVSATTGTAAAVTFTIYVPPIAGTDESQVMGNTKLTSDVAPNVLANDQSLNGGTLSITTTGELTTVRGAKLALAADGSFEYNPVADMVGRDSVQYTINDTYASSNGWIKLAFIGQVWYVQGGYAGTADGRDATPFATLSAAQAVATANDTILVRTGTAHAGAGTLKAGQLVYGAGAAAPFATTLNGKPVTLLATTGAPTLSGLVLGAGNTIRGFNTTGAITGNAFGTLTVSDVSINNPTGQALALATGTLVGGFNSLSSGAGTNNLSLVNVSTTSTVTLGQAGNVFANATSDAVVVSGGDGSFVIPVNISNAASAARAVNVTSRTGGTLTFSGSINPSAGGSGIAVLSSTGGSVVFSGASKRINSAAASGVLLTNNTGADIQFLNGGLEVVTTTGTPFTATGGGTLVVSGPGNTISATNNAQRVVDLLSVTIGAAGVSFNSITSTGVTAQTAFRGQSVAGGTFTAGTINLAGSSARAIDLTSNTAPFAFNGGTVSNAVGELVHVSGGTSTVTVAANLTQSTAGRIVNVTGRTEQPVAFTGTLSCTASCTGISVGSNTGGSVAFSGSSKVISTGSNPAVTLATNPNATIEFTGGGLAITTGTGNGFAATGGGTVRVAGANNVVTSVGGVALNVSNTTIGSGGLNFRSISANGGINGIVLSGTGSTAGLTVTGDGSTAGSGGTIQNSSGADGSTNGIGVYLNSTLSPSLSWMQVSNHNGWGIRGAGVTNLTLANVTVNGTNGTDASTDEGSVYFSELTGVASVTNSAFSGGAEDNFKVFNTTGTLNRITFTNVNFGANSTALGSDALLLQGRGNSVLNATITGSTFTSSRGDLFQYLVEQQAQGDLVFTGNTLSNNHPNITSNGGGMTVTSGGDPGTDVSALTYNISGNTLRGSRGAALVVQKLAGSGSATGTVNNNQIGLAGQIRSGSIEASGISMDLVGAGIHTTSITNNTIRQYRDHGIYVQTGNSVAGGGNNGKMVATITGNTVAERAVDAGTGTFFPGNGIRFVNGNVNTDVIRACLTISNNTVAGQGVSPQMDIRVWDRYAAGTFALPGLPAPVADASAFVQGNNVGSPSTQATSADQFVTTCP